jgi:hypothetical protein
MKDIQVSLNDVIKILNEALESDREAITKLFTSRVECNEDLANHPTIQVGDYHGNGKHMVGILGLLNGLFGIRADGRGYLCAYFEVVCPNGHAVVVEGATIDDICPFCDEQYVLGQITEFKFTPGDENEHSGV